MTRSRSDQPHRSFLQPLAPGKPLQPARRDAADTVEGAGKLAGGIGVVTQIGGEQHGGTEVGRCGRSLPCRRQATCAKHRSWRRVVACPGHKVMPTGPGPYRPTPRRSAARSASRSHPATTGIRPGRLAPCRGRLAGGRQTNASCRYSGARYVCQRLILFAPTRELDAPVRLAVKRRGTQQLRLNRQRSPRDRKCRVGRAGDHLRQPSQDRHK